LFAIAAIYERTGDVDAAIAAYEEVTERFGNNAVAARAQLLAAQDMRAARLYRESNTALLALLKKWPATEYRGAVELLIGLNARDAGAWDQARDYFAAAAADGDRATAVEATYNLGLCELERGDTRAARMQFTKIVTTYRDFPEWVRQAESHLQ
jgi:TolA-binding protein